VVNPADYSKFARDLTQPFAITRKAEPKGESWKITWQVEIKTDPVWLSYLKQVAQHFANMVEHDIKMLRTIALYNRPRAFTGDSVIINWESKCLELRLDVQAMVQPMEFAVKLGQMGFDIETGKNKS